MKGYQKKVHNNKTNNNNSNTHTHTFKNKLNNMMTYTKS